MSTPFTDAKGRQWHLSWTVGSLGAIRDALEIDLFKVDEDPQLQLRLRTDDELLVNTLFVLVEDQCKAAGLTDRDFGGGLDGDSLQQAEGAFWAEAVRFFRGHRRQQLEQTLAIQEKLESKAVTAIKNSLTPEAVLDEAGEKFQEEIQSILASRGCVGSSPGSSD